MGMDGRLDAMLNTATLQITNQILTIIADIDEFKGAWRALGVLAPDRLSVLRRVATIESIGSSTRIEGSKLTDKEVEILLSNLEIKAFESRDEQEVAGYARVMETVFNHWEDISFTENHIKQLHRDLLQFSDKDLRHRGQYKVLSNNVEAFDENGNSIGIVFETATPFETPQRMTELMNWLNQTLDEKFFHPLLTIAIFVVTFLAIHPFQDGNGRLSRVLTTLALLRAGYLYVPYYSLESIIEQNKESYYLALRRTQATIQTNDPDWQPWVEYFLKTLQQQKSKLQTKVEREKILIGKLPEVSLKILEIAKQHGRVTVSEAVNVTKISRNTIKDHLKVLVEQNYLTRHGAGRGTWYSVR